MVRRIVTGSILGSPKVCLSTEKRVSLTVNGGPTPPPPKKKNITEVFFERLLSKIGEQSKSQEQSAFKLLEKRAPAEARGRCTSEAVH